MSYEYAGKKKILERVVGNLFLIIFLRNMEAFIFSYHVIIT